MDIRMTERKYWLSLILMGDLNFFVICTFVFQVLFSLLNILLLFCYCCPNFYPFAHLLPAHSPAPTVNPHPVVHVRGSFIHIP